MALIENTYLDTHTPEERQEFIALLKNSKALFVYNKNTVTADSRRQIDEENYRVRPEFRGGVLVAPISVFDAPFGCSIEKNSITLGKKCVVFRKNSKKYTVGNKIAYFSTAPFSHLSHTYVPVAELAEALGLSALSLNKGRLLVFGGRDEIKALASAVAKNPALEFAGGSAVIGEYDVSKLTHADFIAAKKKWREALVSSPEKIDTSDSVLMEKVTSVHKRARELWETLNRGEDRCILWGDEPPTESRHLRFQYDMLYQMTLGYATFGGELYHNEDLKRDILDSFLWMYENMYGEAELAGTGWRSIHAFNWWDWYLGAMIPMMDAMIIMDDFFTYEEKKKYLKLFEYLIKEWRNGEGQKYSSGRIIVGTKCGLILEQPERIDRAAKDYDVMLGITMTGEGTRPDFCNYQHGFPYNMMYGLSNVERVLMVSSRLAGTPLELSSPRFYNQFELFKYMYEAAMYRGRSFISFRGRASSGSERRHGPLVVTSILPMIGNYGPEEDEYIRRFVKYSLSSPEQIELAKKLCPLGNYHLLKNIIEDETLSSENTYECAHAWFSADRAVQHKDDYAFFVSMPSYRHPNYESINNANKMGWYMNDGALYLYTKTDSHEFDGVNFVLNPRIAHRIPGTTVDVREREAVSIASGWKPLNDRVGCMDFENKYIVAGMDYTAYNRDTAEEKEDRGYGGGNPKFVNDLTAKKAYFMLDDECVCLGAGISSTMDSEINTVAEHRRLVRCENNGFEDEKVITDGKMIEGKTFDISLKNSTWVALEGFAGYYFADADNISICKYMHKTDLSLLDKIYAPMAEESTERPFIEIMINHGKNPRGATYAYAVLPYADEEKMAAYAKAPGFKILSNTPSCQAVKAKSGVSGIVFYEAGECAGIKADRPCLVTFSERRGIFKIKVCEPTNKTDKVKLEIRKRLTLANADPRYKIKCADTVKLTLDVSLSAGEGYEATFKKERQ